jgi:hypothetical protein
MLTQSCLFAFMNSQSISSICNVHNYRPTTKFIWKFAAERWKLIKIPHHPERSTRHTLMLFFGGDQASSYLSQTIDSMFLVRFFMVWQAMIGYDNMTRCRWTYMAPVNPILAECHLPGSRLSFLGQGKWCKDCYF